MADSIKTVAARAKLSPRRAPYWERLTRGCALGFRKMTAGSEGTWLAQFYDPATRKQTRKSLGPMNQVDNAGRYDAAKKAADAWFEHVGAGGSDEVVTVKRACELYAKSLRDAKRTSAAKDASARFARLVNPKKIATIELPKLRRRHVDDWRRELTSTPATLNARAPQEQHRTRPRAPSTINRDMAAVRAALNYALDQAHVTTDAAWRTALRPIESADGRRDVYLTPEQRRALADAAPVDAATLIRGLSLLPLRPGAIAALTAGKYDRKLEVLAVGKDKAGRDRKIKLPPATAAFFDALAKDKLPGAPLFARANGKAWKKDDWKDPVKMAAAAANLPAETVLYVLRHSTITDLVVGGLDLLTIAQLSGTSVAMIEKHYGHLRPDHAAKALAQLQL